jgi:hypothetical protein
LGVWQSRASRRSHIPVTIGRQFDFFPWPAELLQGTFMIGWCSNSFQRRKATKHDGFRQDVGGFIVIWVGEFPMDILQSGSRQIGMEVYFNPDGK